MTTNVPFLFCGILLLFIIVSPVAATQTLTTVSCNPNPPLVPGDHQHMVANYMITPSGSTTFPKGHNLQMQTDLTDAQWTIQVIVDGDNAARQTASGSTAFVNGEILSYSTNHDVSFTVTIDGTVPKTATGTVTLLNMVEIDNTGTAMPGSQSVITQPVAGTSSAQVTAASAVPTLTPPLVTSAITATPRSPGFPASLGIAAVALAGLVWMRRRS
jgi:hypothetical protein